MNEATPVQPRPYWVQLLVATLPVFVVVVAATLLLKRNGWSVPLPISQGVLLFSFAFVLPNAAGARIRPLLQRVGIATLVGAFGGLATWVLESGLFGR